MTVLHKHLKAPANSLGCREKHSVSEGACVWVCMCVCVFTCMFGGTRHEKASLPHSAWCIATKHMDVSTKGTAIESWRFFPTDLNVPRGYIHSNTSCTRALWQRASIFQVKLLFFCFLPHPETPLSKCCASLEMQSENAKWKKKIKTKAEKSHFLFFCKWGQEGRQEINSNLKSFNIFRNSCQQKTVPFSSWRMLNFPWKILPVTVSLPACLVQGCEVPGHPHAQDRPGAVIISGWVKDTCKGCALGMHQMCWAGGKLVRALALYKASLSPSPCLTVNAQGTAYTERSAGCNGTRTIGHPAVYIQSLDTVSLMRWLPMSKVRLWL